MIGQVVGNYKIVEKIGEGGMGAVYKGVDLMLEREVAIKALRPELGNQPQVVERFRSEAVTLAKLNHPNIATLYSFFRQSNDYFMVLEFVRGATLDRVVGNQHAMSCEQAIPLFCQVLEGIDHAHRFGVIHRDIKPGNMMLTDLGILKVLDFGIARVLGTARMTKAGHLIGTIEYMSPEQVRGAETDARSDIYSLGLLLYEMLTGRVPFASDSEFDLMKSQVEDIPPPPRAFAPHIPDEVEQAILRALAKKPEDRFQTAGEFRAALLNSGFKTAALNLGVAPLNNNFAPDQSFGTTPLSNPQLSNPQSGNPQSGNSQSGNPQSGVNPFLTASQQHSPPSSSPPSSPASPSPLPPSSTGSTAMPPASASPVSADVSGATSSADSAQNSVPPAGNSANVEAAKETRLAMPGFSVQPDGTAATNAASGEPQPATTPPDAASPFATHASNAYDAASMPVVAPHAAGSHAAAGSQVAAGATLAAAARSSSLPFGLNAKILAVVAGALVLLVLVGGVVGLLAWRQVAQRRAAEEAAAAAAQAEQEALAARAAAAQADVPPAPPDGMVYVPGGAFTMGRDDGDEYERPAHEVSVKPFFIDIYEVTNEDYEKFVKETSRQPPQGWKNGTYPEGAAKRPVTGVSWDDASAYAAWAGKRLPTEDEWEFAARGTDGRLYPWGNEWQPGLANADKVNKGVKDVGEYKGASLYGTYDMVGNAWEWTASDMAAYPAGALPAELSTGKVIRGGCYVMSSATTTTTIRRGWLTQGAPTYADTGFRCAKDATASPNN